MSNCIDHWNDRLLSSDIIKLLFSPLKTPLLLSTLIISPSAFFQKVASPFLIIFTNVHCPWIFCCVNLWTCNISKERTESLLIFLISCILFFLSENWENHIFVKDLICIQNNENTDGVDRVHQHPKASQSCSSSWVDFSFCNIGHFDLYCL